MGEEEEWKTLLMEEKYPNIIHVYLNRPSQRNALSKEFFEEFPKALKSLDLNPNVHVIVLAGLGQHFCSGIDINSLLSVSSNNKSEVLRRDIKHLQAAITALEECRKPVIASIHGACIGAGVDLITACDIRYCSTDSFFSVKEVDLAITADLGTLQRLPSIVGYGNAMELALTARTLSSSQALHMGLVSRVLDSHPALHDFVVRVAQDIAAKSPLAVTGTKTVLMRSRDLSLEQGLDYVATWNSAMLPSHDLNEAATAFFHKRKPNFSKL